VNERRRNWRRPVATAALLLALLLISTRTCGRESASSEVRFHVGAAGAQVRRLEAELRRPGQDELLGFYRREFDRGSGSEAGRWPLRADAGVYRMSISLRTAGGTVRVERALEMVDGATVTIDLERDLTGAR